MAETKERPIMFSGEMIRAILEGRKTQTRRIIKQQPIDILPMKANDEWVTLQTINPKHGRVIRCRFGIPGDRLWVRETWKPGAWREDDGQIAIDYKASPELVSTSLVQIPDDDDGEKFNYLWISLCNELHAKGIEPGDDEEYHWEHGKSPLKWRSPIFMPHWASRITLEIVNVSVERCRI